MSHRLRGVIVGVGAATAVAFFILATVFPAMGQAQGAYKAPRTADGKPDLNGVWDRPYVPDMSRDAGAAQNLSLGLPAHAPQEAGVFPYAPADADRRQSA